jgi:hypothetical protein
LVILLFPPVRRNRRCLMVLAISILTGKLLEIAWLIFPAIGGDITLMALAAILALLGFGGFSLAGLSASTRFLGNEPRLSRPRRSSV